MSKEALHQARIHTAIPFNRLTAPRRRARGLSLAAALACLGASLATTPAQAATISWDGDTSTAWATGANWVGGTAPASSLTTDMANFSLPAYGGNPVYAPNGGGSSIAGVTISANNGTMTLAGNLSIGGGGIVIANGAGQLTLSGTITPNGYTWLNHSGNPLITTASFPLASSLRVGGAGGFTINSVSSANFTVLAGTGTTAVNYANFSNTGGTWANNSTATVTIGASGINNGNPDTFTGSGNWLVTGNLNGSGTFTKTGFGIFTLQGSASALTGAISIYGGGQFVLNDNGALTGNATALISVNSATLVLDNSTTVVANRIHDNRTLNLGNLTLTGKSGSSPTETVSTTTFGTSGTITINNGSGSDVTTLTLGTVTRSAGAAISFVGNNGTFGTGPKVTSTAWGGASNGILPWGTVNRTSWAADSGGNLVAYSGTFVDPTSAGSAATANAQLTGVGTMNATKSFNSLNVISTAASDSFDLSTAGVLTLTSAGILKSGANAYEIKGTATSAITSGTELIAHVDGGDLTISAKLNTAILGLAKGGSGKLILSGTRAASFTGAIGIDGALEFQGASTTLGADIKGLGSLVGNLTAGQTLTLSSSTHSFTGDLAVNGGTVAIGANDNNSPVLSCAVSLNGGTLNIAGSRANVTVLGLDGTSGSVVSEGNRTLQINVPTSSVYTYAGSITSSGASSGITKQGAGTQELTGTANSYTGPTIVQDGTLTVAKLANFSANSSIGAPTSGDIKIGNAGDTGTLRYTGTGDTANRTIQIGVGTAAGDCGGATIQNDGSGALVFSATTFNTAQSGVLSILPRTLTLQGSSTAANGINGVIQNNTAGATGTGAVALTKAGAGRWVLSGANTYTGDTRVNAGTLALGSGGSLGNTAVTVADVATLSNAVASATSIGGSLTLNSGAKLGLTADAAGVGRVAVTGALTLNGNTLNIHVTGAKLVGGNYIVATYGSRSGTFAATPVFTGLGLDGGVSGASLVFDDDAKTVTLVLAADARRPEVSNRTATPVAFTSATLKGYLNSTGTAATTVWAAWDTNAHPDVATEVPADWEHSAKLTPAPMTSQETELSHPVSSLAHHKTYYYSFFASNSVGTVWALPVTNLVTLNAGPTLTGGSVSGLSKYGATIAATLSSTGAAATTVWAVWDTSDHASATAPTDWPFRSNLLTKAVGSVSNVLTGLSIDTLYYYRFYASNTYGTAWLTPSPTFTTLNDRIVDWQGNYVSGDQAFRAAFSTSPAIDTDSDGTSDDYALYAAFDDTTTPLSPSSGYSGVSAAFYGGVRFDWFSQAAFDGNSLRQVVENTTTDRITTRTTKGNSATSAAIVWIRKDFLLDGSGKKVSFDAASVLSVNLAEVQLSTVRFIVRDGTQYYISQASATAAGLLTLSNPNAANWTAFTPARWNVRGQPALQRRRRDLGAARVQQHPGRGLPRRATERQQRLGRPGGPVSGLRRTLDVDD